MRHFSFYGTWNGLFYFRRVGGWFYNTFTVLDDEVECRNDRYHAADLDNDDEMR